MWGLSGHDSRLLSLSFIALKDEVYYPHRRCHPLIRVRDLVECCSTGRFALITEYKQCRHIFVEILCFAGFPCEPGCFPPPCSGDLISGRRGGGGACHKNPPPRLRSPPGRQLLRLVPDDATRRELAASLPQLTSSRDKWQELEGVFTRNLHSVSPPRRDRSEYTAFIGDRLE